VRDFSGQWNARVRQAAVDLMVDSEGSFASSLSTTNYQQSTSRMVISCVSNVDI
jgi:hypothetical protein